MGETIRADQAALARAIAAARESVDHLTGVLDTIDGASEPALAAREATRLLEQLVATDAAGEHGGDAARSDQGTVILDVSDLIGYFENNRLPTGIQRVQIEVVFNILKGVGDMPARLCCFVEKRSEWMEVDTSLFARICAMSMGGGDPLDPSWLAALGAMRAEIAAGSRLDFPRGAWLVNLGASWWLPNYFLYVRDAKLASGVRYVPLIYDLIPILMPQNCLEELVGEFIGWFTGVLQHADAYLAISEATKADLIRVAGEIGHAIRPEHVAVLSLDAEFGGPVAAAGAQGDRRSRMGREPFVLFVSTIEARKNQIGALEAWQTLMTRHGIGRVPRLVLVGKPGFQSERVLQRLETNPDLREQVLILSQLEDSELQRLYRDCLFTIYPSYYEGWGLPVTESLCYGKVPLVADNSSLPEAGREFAVFHETGSADALVAGLERMLFEPGFRAEREEKIRGSFRPRTWHDIAQQLMQQIGRWSAEFPLAEWRPPMVELGGYHPIVRNRATIVWRNMGSAEVYRRGGGWFRVEDIGCWANQAGADLAMSIPAGKAVRIGLQLVCPAESASYRITVSDTDVEERGAIAIDRPKWVFVDVPPREDGQAVVLHIATPKISGANADPRPLGVGLRGFFVLDPADPVSRLDFLEAVALGALPDYDVYRDRGG